MYFYSHYLLSWQMTAQHDLIPRVNPSQKGEHYYEICLFSLLQEIEGKEHVVKSILILTPISH